MMPLLVISLLNATKMVEVYRRKMSPFYIGDSLEADFYFWSYLANTSFRPQNAIFRKVQFFVHTFKTDNAHARNRILEPILTLTVNHAVTS
mmetsp:Transcript_32386/g.49013  ORF Transcript_32386/g.49013 Transcript_32386/m.49013 type:complete len:91 (+) Transcript_32386:393-665(+)